MFLLDLLSALEESRKLGSSLAGKEKGRAVGKEGFSLLFNTILQGQTTKAVLPTGNSLNLAEKKQLNVTEQLIRLTGSSKKGSFNPEGSEKLVSSRRTRTALHYEEEKDSLLRIPFLRKNVKVALKGKKSAFQEEKTFSIIVSRYREGRDILSADGGKRKPAERKELLQAELLGSSYPVGGKVLHSEESSSHIKRERVPVVPSHSFSFERKFPVLVEDKEVDAGSLTTINNGGLSFSFSDNLLVEEEAGRLTLTKPERSVTSAGIPSISKREELLKRLPDGVSESKSVKGVELHKSKGGVVRKERKHDILLSESRRDFRGVSQLQGVGDGAPSKVQSMNDVSLPSNQEVRHEIAKGESVSPRPATAETGKLLTYYGFEQSSKNHEGSDNFHQESGHQNIQKQVPTYTFSLDLKNFSFRAGFTRNALSLSINFLNEHGITPSLIEEIESVIRSSGIAFGRIQLKVKGRTVYSSSVKKDEVSLELRV